MTSVDNKPNPVGTVNYHPPSNWEFNFLIWISIPFMIIAAIWIFSAITQLPTSKPTDLIGIIKRIDCWCSDEYVKENKAPRFAIQMGVWDPYRGEVLNVVCNITEDTYLHKLDIKMPMLVPYDRYNDMAYCEGVVPRIAYSEWIKARGGTPYWRPIDLRLSPTP